MFGEFPVFGETVKHSAFGKIFFHDGFGDLIGCIAAVNHGRKIQILSAVQLVAENFDLLFRRSEIVVKIEPDFSYSNDFFSDAKCLRVAAVSG